MRQTINKSVSKLVGIWTFLLLLIFKLAFPKPAFAFLSSLDSCAAKPECAAAIGSELAPAVAAPTPAGIGASTISTTTATGATSSVQAVAKATVVGDMRLSGVIAFYIWNQSRNQQAQNQAKERYCSTYPLDEVCGPQGQSSVPYHYKFHEIVHYRKAGYPDKFVTHHYRSWQPAPGPIISLANQYPGSSFGGGYPPSSFYVRWIKLNDGGGNNQSRGVVYEYSTGDSMSWNEYGYYSNNNAEQGWISNLVRADGLPDNSPPLDWKDWPQQKRDVAVNLLNDSDWQSLIKSMPEGGRLNPGDTVSAPTIVIPGQEEDDPNTPADERILKKQPGFFVNPPDFDYDRLYAHLHRDTEPMGLE
ncbi:MAG: hypothetical protein IGS49_08555 [Chlorogloeopsis fritschii C42_A2020_084]|uniref:hypothetical protein n=1 Tax=Chlorogloeopsis fritschii TaxID=1124 RepID=UPI001A02DF24|nr:hypothetical protein [Chlorogloeopsis fritschii]MBF2005503.1 hypothetical protein [Chlorogloeopsis fritschii C42_A2020_084]